MKTTKPVLDKYGIKLVIASLITPLFQLVVLLLCAWDFTWHAAWLFAGIYFLLSMIHVLTLLLVNPGLINERGRAFREDTKPFDKLFFLLWRLLGIVQIVVIGLDQRFFGAAEMHYGFVITGYIAFVGSFFFGLWPPLVNRHFEATVRIQTDRNHAVCDTGPYRLVRHPGYLSSIIAFFSFPLILGSWWGFIPSIMICAAFVWRTAMEDDTLQRELPGYVEYAKKTKYRLFPGIW